MTLCFFLKMLSECSLYFFIVNCALSITLSGVESMMPAFICAAVAALAYHINDKVGQKRVFVLPLLLTVLFFGHSFGTYLAVILPAAYVVLTTVTERYYIDHSSQSDFFRTGMYISMFLSVPFILLMGIEYAAYFVILFLMSSILLLRTLRQDAEIQKERRFSLVNYLTVAAIFLFIVVLSSDAVLTVFTTVFSTVYDIIIYPVAFLLTWFVQALYFVVLRVVTFLFPDYEVDWEALEIITAGMGNHEPAMKEEEAMGAMDPTLVLLAKGFVILASVIALLVFFFVRTQKGRNKPAESVREVRRSVTDYRPEEKIYSDIFPPREPRAAVRYHYRNFLRLCGRLGHNFPLYYNSQYIENVVSHQFDEKSLKSLRQTYIRARYSEHPVSKEDVASIKAQVKYLEHNTGALMETDKDTFR